MSSGEAVRGPRTTHCQDIVPAFLNLAHLKSAQADEAHVIAILGNYPVALNCAPAEMAMDVHEQHPEHARQWLRTMQLVFFAKEMHGYPGLTH